MLELCLNNYLREIDFCNDKFNHAQSQHLIFFFFFLKTDYINTFSIEAFTLFKYSFIYSFIYILIVKMATQPLSPNDVRQENLQAYLKQQGFRHWDKVKDMTYSRIVKASQSQLDDSLKTRGIADGLVRSDYVAAITQLPQWIENHPYQSGGMYFGFFIFLFSFLFFSFLFFSFL